MGGYLLPQSMLNSDRLKIHWLHFFWSSLYKWRYDPLLTQPKKKQQLLNRGSSFQPKLLSAGFYQPKNSSWVMMVVKGASRCRFEKITGKFSAGQKNLNESLASETRPQGCVLFWFEDFSEWGQKKKHITRMNRVLFFGSFPPLMPPAKRVHGMGRVENVQDFLLNFSGRQKLPIQKKRKCAKVLGSYNDSYGLMTYFEKRNPWQNHPFLWYVSGKLVICHSYVSLQEWLFRKKKQKNLPSNSSPALSIGHAEPQVWQDLEKAWKKNRSSGGRVHHFLA